MSDKPQDRWRRLAKAMPLKYVGDHWDYRHFKSDEAEGLLGAADLVDGFEAREVQLREMLTKAHLSIRELEEKLKVVGEEALHHNGRLIQVNDCYKSALERLSKENFTGWQVQNLARAALGGDDV